MFPACHGTFSEYMAGRGSMCSSKNGCQCAIADKARDCCRRDRVSLNEIANECTFGLITAVLDMGYTLSKVRAQGCKT